MSSWLWSERFWLPERVKWDDFAPRVVDGKLVTFPQFYELGYGVLAGVILLFLRIFVESFVQLPVGRAIGLYKLKEGQSTLSASIAHFNGGCLSQSRFKKVAETVWRLVYYSTIWVVGIYVLHDQPQWMNVDDSWRNYPFHAMVDKVWWYYTIQSGFYWSLLIGSFTIDVKRSDFWEMVIHHVATILLLSLSWTTNFVRVGTLVLICHDTADILLDLGKLFRYAKWERALTVTFLALLVTWILTRILLFPLIIIRSIVVSAPKSIQADYEWLNLLQRPIVPRIFTSLLLILLILHFFWTFLMLKIAYKSTQKGGGVDDIREDSSSEDDKTKQE
ncbi:unnamed protein product [Bursaphelenchus xylophilus]|uniref:(pine wood nematode) hypothetical protein n=1 Tax=Bursaphelenchus xylophilus TaxID=6326 RepID=A0A1I7RWG2_BURXY|nr:unnamed protein product [Bursaphelenchus xylophilus]CAG9128349.1 unnamed protein product [Bursaphelenchus xylophilus]